MRKNRLSNKAPCTESLSKLRTMSIKSPGVPAAPLGVSLRFREARSSLRSFVLSGLRSVVEGIDLDAKEHEGQLSPTRNTGKSWIVRVSNAWGI